MIDILANPRGEIYRRLVRFAAQQCDTFSLVWRWESATDIIEGIENRLRPHLIREVQTNEWPGTVLAWHTAIVRHYTLNDVSRALIEEADSLYSWLAPERPEDLAFYDREGQCWLGSIAHEEVSFIPSEAIALDELRAAVPGLKCELGQMDG